MAWNNLFNFLAGGTASAELSETTTRYERVQDLLARSPYTEDRLRDFIVEIVSDACHRAGLIPIDPLTTAMLQVVDDLIAFDSMIFGLPKVANFGALTVEEAADLRTLLVRKERFLMDHERQLDIWREKVVRTLAALLEFLPPTTFKDSWDDADPDEGVPGATVELVDLMEAPAETIERLLVTFNDDDVTRADLFTSLREQLVRRLCVAS